MKRVLMLFLFGLISVDRASKECLEDNPEECESKDESVDTKDIKVVLLRLEEMEKKLLTAYVQEMENACKEISNLTAIEDDVSSIEAPSTMLKCPLPPPVPGCICPSGEKGDPGYPGYQGPYGQSGSPGLVGEPYYLHIKDFPFVQGRKGDKGEPSVPCNC